MRGLKLLFRLALVIVAAGLVVVPAASTDRDVPAPMEKPNIVLILADDLDAGSTNRMPKLRSNLVEQGTTFEDAFVTTPQCCPSRATILTGKYAHNHTVYDNNVADGGARKFHDSGEEESTIATWLDEAGYETILIGKYLNWYDGTHVPPGWDEWYGQTGRNNDDHRYNVNGRLEYYDPEKYHDTELFSDWAARHLRAGAGRDRPFFMYLSVNAPHQPAIPPERHEDGFASARAPRPPSFDEADTSDKPKSIRALPPLTAAQTREIDRLHRDRLRSMLGVDDMIGRLTAELARTGELDDTYIFLTSDNGFHMGQHRLEPGKGRPYEEDIRVPLYVRGPGVPHGRTLDHKVLNLDFAPTFADLGGANTPDAVDGRSLVPLLAENAPPADPWRESFLVEFFQNDDFLCAAHRPVHLRRVRGRGAGTLRPEEGPLPASKRARRAP